jgi:uncharacterized protein
MTARPFDPLRLDVAAFAAAGGELDGRWPLRDFDRVSAAAAEHAPTEAAPVAWQARGERRSVRQGAAETWLHLHADTTVVLQCQRCLAPVRVPLEVNRDFLFVAGEDAAARLDAAIDDDVLALTRALDLRELIEDELLLALPLVALHEQCPVPLLAAQDAPVEEPHPFAALAALKSRGPLN